MGELISRQAVLDKMFGITVYKGTVPIDTVIWQINQLPSAEPEQKTGKWIEAGPQDYPCVCSVCGIAQDIKAKFLFSFCPNCGADMRGEENDF